MRKFLFQFILLTFSTISFSQVEYSVWSNIEISIAQKKSLQVTHQRLIDIAGSSLASMNYPQYARARFYKLVIDDLRSEDTAYFRNSAFIDSILHSTVSSQLKLFMHLLQAKRLLHFSKKYLRFNRSLYQTRNTLYNYAKFSGLQMDSIIDFHFDQAAILFNAANNYSPEEFTWISAEPGKILFKPTLLDIIISEQIDYYSSQVYPIDEMKIDSLEKFLDLSQADFINKLSWLKTINSNAARTFSKYLQWIQSKKDVADKFYVETLARKYAYSLSQSRNLSKEKYKSYLDSIIQSPYGTVRAHGIYQLSLLLHSQASNYRNEYTNEVDSSYQFHSVRALRLYEKNKILLDSFPILTKVLEEMKSKILQTTLGLELNAPAIPGEPLLGQLTYRNVHHVYYRVVRLNQYEKVESKNFGLEYLATKNAFVEQRIKVPLPPDHQTHFAILKIDPLPTGRYAILLSDDTIYRNRIFDYYIFNVSNLAIVELGKKAVVINRKSGMPINSSKLFVKYEDKNGTILQYSLKPDKSGTVNVPNDAFGYYEILSESDTLQTSLSIKYDHYDDFRYDEDEYDDLVEFFDDNVNISVFTDRAIYRPGQTVHFKAILTTRDHRTGNVIVMNEENMNVGLFRNQFKKWLKEYQPLLLLNDPFSRIVDSFKLIPNEFGSFSGSFSLSKNAPTGSWTLESDYHDMNSYNEGEFEVEEYKRPTYEITIKPSTEKLLPGTPFSVRVKVRSFTGASLNNVLINYTLSRNGSLPGKKNYSAELIDSTGFTNAEGELLIAVDDSVLRKLDFGPGQVWFYRYYLEIEAIDETGESYEASEEMSVSSLPVSIRTLLENVYDRNDLPTPRIGLNHMNAGEMEGIVKVSVYRLADDPNSHKTGLFVNSDQWLYSPDELAALFPGRYFILNHVKDTQLVYEQYVNISENQKLSLPKDKIIAGKYFYSITYSEEGILRGKKLGNFSVFDFEKNMFPERTNSFHYTKRKIYSKGDTSRFFSGNSEYQVNSLFLIQWFSKKGKIIIQQERLENRILVQGLNEVKFIVPGNAMAKMTITQCYILNNKMYTNTETIYLEGELENAPEIIVEQYRTSLSPGDPAKFSISVKSRNENVIAELMSTMYDASLDKLSSHQWRLPHSETRDLSEGIYTRYISGPGTLRCFDKRVVYFPKVVYPFIWWSEKKDLFGLNGKLNSLSFDRYNYGYLGSMLEGRVPGLVVSAEGLDEVVVTAYGVKRQMSAGSYSKVQIRGAASISSFNVPLVIIDGEIFTGDINLLDAATFIDGIVLRGADAAIYGSRASSGVIVLSTKGRIVLPEIKTEAPKVKIRKNFNETAFFFPNIYADRKGYYIMQFNMPESVTEWNWKLFAHTKNTQFAYASRKITTRLPLMVQPNMPRVLYEGDKIYISSRVTNLDTISVSGKVTCRIEDAITGEDISSLVLKKEELQVSIEKSSNSVATFEVQLSPGRLNPLRIIISVVANGYGDAEEHVIPVLSKSILAKSTVPFTITNDESIALPSLPTGAKPYGIGICLSPKPEAGIVNSLPYLANYPYKCAEQTFNKMWAHLIALSIMRTDENMRNVFEAAKTYVDTAIHKESLPDEIAEETMPWLKLSNNTRLLQRQLFQLLDTSKTEKIVADYLDKLVEFQNSDGGLAWFNGGLSNVYISNYILFGFGQLLKRDWDIVTFQNGKYRQFINGLVLFADNAFLNQPNLYYCYSRPAWKMRKPASDSIIEKVKIFLHKRFRNETYGLREEAMVIMATMAWLNPSDSNYGKAKLRLENLRQLAIYDEVNGIRWKAIADEEDLTYSSEEMLSMMVEVFENSEDNSAIKNGVIKWLLNNRAEHNWGSTKSTAAVINLLLGRESGLIDATQTVSTVIENEGLSVSNDLLQGELFDFVKTGEFPGTIDLKKSVNGIVNGAVISHYFISIENLGGLNTDINLTKKLQRLKDSNTHWENIKEGDTLATGSKIRVVIQVETSKALRYVYLNDIRGAALEPVNGSSGYEHWNGLSGYKSVRDASVQFFMDIVPAGISEITYELKVAHTGIFTVGPAKLQCMYNPGKVAYSDSFTILTR